MLSKILSKNDCRECKFCCSFRRQSLWELPLFDWREPLDLLPLYKTDDPDEEVPCPYLEDGKGCTLSAEKKPFDCKIWPLRVVSSKENSELQIVLTPTCKAINKVPLEKIRELVNTELKDVILSYAKEHPEIIKNDSEFFIKL